MKALFKMENMSMCLKDIEEPEIMDADDVKIRVRYTTICSDELRGDEEGDYFSRESVLGHEMCGDIVELGEMAEMDGFKVGDKVTGIAAMPCGRCRSCKNRKEQYCLDMRYTTGTLCKYIVWKSKQLVKLDDEIPYIHGCLIEPVAAVLEAIEKTNISFGDSICIFGAGFTGLIFLQLFRMRGATSITVVDPIEERRIKAKEIGADYVLDCDHPGFKLKMADATDFSGFDIIVETSSNIDAVYYALNAIGRGGRLLLFTYYGVNEKINFNTMHIYTENITILSSFMSNRKLEIAAKMLPLLKLDELSIGVVKFEDSILAFKAKKAHKYIINAIKI